MDIESWDHNFLILGLLWVLHFDTIARRESLVEVVFNFFQLSDEVGLIGEFFPDDMA